MELWLWIAIGALIAVIGALSIKIYLMQKSAREIEREFSHRLSADTNTLIDISSGDIHMRRLANSINRELRALRSQRHRFEQGDTELKNAVTNISHDLRTPLTAIFGYLDLLEREENTENAGRYIKIIKGRTETLKELTEELFRYSVIVAAPGDGGLSDVVINDVLTESIAGLYAALSERKIEPVVSLPENAVVRKLDAAALSRVFSNLINNAIKYSDGDLSIELFQDGKAVFSNSASNLDEVQVGRLFDRFYTVEAARKSTGLGLAIAKTLLEKMGGEIFAAYENGRLKITIIFPGE